MATVDLPIKRIEAVPVTLPRAVDFNLAGGGQPEAYHVIVRLYTEDGPTGIGEVGPNPAWSAETQQSAIGALKHIDGAMQGENAARITRIHEIMDETLKENPFAKAAVDTACYDALGKELELPVSALLGGRVRDRIEAGISIGIKETDRATADAESYVYEDGFSSVKVKVGDDPESATERIRAIANTVGDDASIRIDANQGYTPDVALPMFSQLERDIDILIVEQPVGGNDFDGMKKLTRALETPVMADESVSDLTDVFRLGKRDAADLVHLKYTKAGGLYVYKQMEAVAMAIGTPPGSGGAMVQTGIGTAAAMHGAVTIADLRYPSDIRGPLYFDGDLLTDPLRIEDGYTYIPDGPGLGIELDESTLDEYRTDR